MLVVIAIIAILAGLLLPALNRAKQQAKLARCQSNLKQIGYGFQMYGDDNRERFPPNGRNNAWVSFQYGGRDPDWTSPDVKASLPLLQGTNRPLWPYLGSSEAFHCSADRGIQIDRLTTCKDIYWHIGTSYKYNDIPWCQTRHPQADPLKGLSEKPINWVPDPSRFVLLHEFPALPDLLDGVWAVWHFGRGPATVRSASGIRQEVISPILFVDGHVRALDFTAAVKRPFPAEPTVDCLWYKPQ